MSHSRTQAILDTLPEEERAALEAEIAASFETEVLTEEVLVFETEEVVEKVPEVPEIGEEVSEEPVTENPEITEEPAEEPAEEVTEEA